jgi:hypothetical protein
MVFLWRNQYVLLSYGTINSQSALVVRCLRPQCARTHARQDFLIDVDSSHLGGLVRSQCACAYALKPIPQRMDLRERKHASQSLSLEPIQHKSNLTINFDNGNQW